MSKRNSAGHSLVHTIPIHDLRTAQNFLASYDYPSATIGIHNYLVRSCDNEQFIKFTQQGSTTEDFIAQLDEKEKTPSNKSHVDIERCAIITRLRYYLTQDRRLFRDILNKIHIHLHQSMKEDSPPSNQRSSIEIAQQCRQRNEAAKKLRQAHHIGRLQFNVTQPSMNIINLQKWISNDFQLFIHIMSKSSDRTRWIAPFQTLLNDSFFIILHPSPPVATHGTRVNGSVTAKIKARVICLLDRSQSTITIDNITPIVRRVPAQNQSEESDDTTYEQAPMNWKTYSIITASNNYQTYSCADLLEINLRQPSTVRTHYAPLVYRIDFCINITIHFPNNPHQTRVILQSAPFGLISNTSQEEELFARVFIEDIKSCKPSPRLLTTMSNNIDPLLSTTDLTIEDILHSIEHYFIHQTGIRPKGWVMPYIENVLRSACQNQSDSIESLCHNHLVKILAQIDYMTKHPLLSLFHEDGFFLGICDDDAVQQNLLYYRQFCPKSICAIRFGAMCRMSDLKEIGIRVILVESEKLLAICPHEERYSSIWQHTYHNETQGNTDNNNSGYNPCTTDQTQPYYSSQLPLQPYHPQPDETFYSTAPQITQTDTQPPPIIIVVTNPYNCVMSNEDVLQLTNNQLPQFSHLLQISPIYRIDTSQTFSSNSISTNDLLNPFDSLTNAH